MRYQELLLEDLPIPIIDKYLAQSVMDASVRLGFTFRISNLTDVLTTMQSEWEEHIKPAIDGNNLNVYRAIAVAASHQIRHHSLGVFWSTVPKTAHPYWAKSRYWLTLHALVDLKHVNWDETFALHLEGGENEVRLYSGTPVKIINVKWNSDNPEHDLDTSAGQELIGKMLTT